MASGHVSRTRRPHTWLLRPDCDVQKVLANKGPFHTWHSSHMARSIHAASVQNRTTTPMALLASRPEEFHLQALLEPCRNLSIHTAPDVRPLPWHKTQWAKRCGFARRNRSNQSRPPLVRWRIRL